MTVRMTKILYEIFELLLDSEQPACDSRGGDANYGGNLIITHALQPKKNDGAVEQFKAVDSVVQHLDLPPNLIGFTQNILVDKQRNGWYIPFLASLHFAAGVQADAPYPRLGTAVAAELGIAFPEVDQHFLEEVIHISGIV